MEVIVVDACRIHGPGVRVHRVAELSADERTSIHGIPITAPARTLLDLARSVGRREMEQALALAERRRLADREQVANLLTRYPRRSGSRALRALLTQMDGPALTHSEAERQFLDLVQKARLRRPETNVNVAGHEVDVLWRAERLIAEVDGFACHSSEDAFEKDRLRDGDLTAAGFRVLRITWKQLCGESESLLVRIATALARPSGG